MTKRVAFKWIGAIAFLLTLQTLTYFTIAPKQLKSKLLPVYFPAESHDFDSLFVRDFFVGMCGNSYDYATYYSNNLKDDEEMLKKRFRVSHVYFDSEETFSWSNPMEEKIKLRYSTWISRPDLIFKGFAFIQVEELYVDKKYYFKREVIYQWVLFFPIETFEWIDTIYYQP